MKRILIAISALMVVALIIVACKTTPTPNPPAPSPKMPGCSMKFTALGNNLVAYMAWTNPATGSSAQGMQFSITEFAGTLTVLVDPSISCATNFPNVVAVSFVCCGTNLPNAIPLRLPADCNGFQASPSADCGACTFRCPITNSNDFSCGIMSNTPRK